jgi:hypothetical protein
MWKIIVACLVVVVFSGCNETANTIDICKYELQLTKPNIRFNSFDGSELLVTCMGAKGYQISRLWKGGVRRCEFDGSFYSHATTPRCYEKRGLITQLKEYLQEW